MDENIGVALDDALSAFLDGDFKNYRERDFVVQHLSRALSDEHRRLTHEENRQCRDVFAKECRLFIQDVYFGGRHPSADIEACLLVERARKALCAMLRQEVCGTSKGVLYADELKELRIRLMDRQGVCSRLESKMPSVSGEWLYKLRMEGYTP